MKTKYKMVVRTHSDVVQVFFNSLMTSTTFLLGYDSDMILGIEIFRNINGKYYKVPLPCYDPENEK